MYSAVIEFIHAAVSVFTFLFRMVAAVDGGWGYLLSACGVSPAAQVFLLAGIGVIIAGIVLRGIGGVVGMAVLLIICLMILEIEVPQLASTDWVILQLRTVF